MIRRALACLLLLLSLITHAVVAAEPAPAAKVDTHSYDVLRDGLNNCRVKFEQDKTGRVAFLGGSITAMNGWRQMVMADLEKRFPQTKFEFIGAGIPSLGSVPHAFRLERDVLAHGPIDLLFVEAAVNDSSNTGDHPEQILRGMEGVIRHVRTVSPMTDIVQMHFAMTSHFADYKAGRLPVSIAQHERVAEHYGNASVDLSHETCDRINAGEFTWAGAFGSVHPKPPGQKLYADGIARLLDAAWAQPVGPVKAHALPAEPLDPLCYARGRFGDIADAKIIQGFKVVENWKPSRRAGTRGGYVNVPVLEATEPDAAFEFAFDGTGAGLMIGAGPDTGVIEVTCDDGPTKTIDTFTNWSKGL
ncbi:MAG: hypothetical protein GC159_07160 [Phycisphaera sp.]|nr:hypothetical protein [Phycisphaera sp.]